MIPTPSKGWELQKRHSTWNDLLVAHDPLQVTGAQRLEGPVGGREQGVVSGLAQLLHHPGRKRYALGRPTQSTETPQRWRTTPDKTRLANHRRLYPIYIFIYTVDITAYPCSLPVDTYLSIYIYTYICSSHTYSISYTLASVATIVYHTVSLYINIRCIYTYIVSIYYYALYCYICTLVRCQILFTVLYLCCAMTIHLNLI